MFTCSGEQFVYDRNSLTAGDNGLMNPIGATLHGNVAAGSDWLPSAAKDA